MTYIITRQDRATQRAIAEYGEYDTIADAKNDFPHEWEPLNGEDGLVETYHDKANGEFWGLWDVTQHIAFARKAKERKAQAPPPPPHNASYNSAIK